MSASSSHPYDAILRAANRRPQLWRIVVAVLMALAIMAIATPAFYALVRGIAPELTPLQFTTRGIAIGTTPGGLFVILAGFALLLGGTLILARRLHDRGLRDLTGPAPLMRKQFFDTFKWMVGLMLISFLLPWDGADNEIAENLPFGMWLFWLPFAVLGLLIQILAEELFFRGYLQSQLIASTKSYVLGLCAASVLFGMGHINGTAEGLAALFPVIWAMFFGLMAGDLTARAGTIGPACALHLVNNASALLLAPQQDTMSGFGLMKQTSDVSDLYSDPKIMLFEGLLLLISWLAARIAIRR
nr:CPBP family intramembrane glutamic endopeptidase [uncultured Celeribacter sp.]